MSRVGPGSSSRGGLFSFSDDLRCYVGDPSALDAAVLAAFPMLASPPDPAVVRYYNSEMTGPGVGLPPGASIPAGEVVGLFAGHVFLASAGELRRGDRLLPLPPFRARGAELLCAVDGAARASRFPSPREAAIYRHSCEDPTLLGEWWMGGPIPCLIARTARELRGFDQLEWDFNVQAEGGYTMNLAAARAWRRAGGCFAPCPCFLPHDCPSEQFVRRTAPSRELSPAPSPAVRRRPAASALLGRADQ